MKLIYLILLQLVTIFTPVISFAGNNHKTTKKVSSVYKDVSIEIQYLNEELSIMSKLVGSLVGKQNIAK